MKNLSIQLLMRTAGFLLLVGLLMQCAVSPAPNAEAAARTFTPTELPKFCTPPSKVFRKVQPDFVSDNVSLPLHLVRYRLPNGEYVKHIAGFRDGCERRLLSDEIKFWTYLDLVGAASHAQIFEDSPKVRGYIRSVLYGESIADSERILDDENLLVTVIWRNETNILSQQDLIFDIDGFIVGRLLHFTDGKRISEEVIEVNVDG